MRYRRADLCNADLMFGAQAEHWLTVWSRTARQRVSAKRKDGPVGFLRVNQRALTIRVKAGEIRERSSGVADAELRRGRGEYQRRGRLVAAEMSKAVAGGGPQESPARRVRVDADGIVKRTVGGQGHQLVDIPILVERAGVRGGDERARLASNGVGVEDFDCHRLRGQSVSSRYKRHSNERGSRARERRDLQPDTAPERFTWRDCDRALLHLSHRPAFGQEKFCVDSLHRVAEVGDLEGHNDVAAGLCAKPRFSGSKHDLPYEADVDLDWH